MVGLEEYCVVMVDVIRTELELKLQSLGYGSVH